MAKAKIIIASAQKEFTPEQIRFIRRMMTCLTEHHGLSVAVELKEKKQLTLKKQTA